MNSREKIINALANCKKENREECASKTNNTKTTQKLFATLYIFHWFYIEGNSIVEQEVCIVERGNQKLSCSLDMYVEKTSELIQRHKDKLYDYLGNPNKRKEVNYSEKYGEHTSVRQLISKLEFKNDKGA